MGKVDKYLSLLTIVFLLSSCGSRKVEIEQQKVRTKHLTEMVLKLQNDIQSNIRMTKVANKKTIEPVDPTLPSTYNGQDFKNARITEEETKTDSTALVNDKSITGINVSNQSESSSERKSKNSESKGNSKDIKTSLMWVFLIVVVVGGVFVFGKVKKWF